MQNVKVIISGRINVTLQTNAKGELAIKAGTGVAYNYCPQTQTVSITEGNSHHLSLNYPSYVQLCELEVNGSTVVLENLTIPSLNACVINNNSRLSLRGNTIDQLSLLSDSRNTIDMTQQALPKRFSYQASKDTTIRMPNQGPPMCVACYENEVSRVFLACGHWCLCSNCASLQRCPICRAESAQLRVIQQSAVHYC